MLKTSEAFLKTMAIFLKTMTLIRLAWYYLEML